MEPEPRQADFAKIQGLFLKALSCLLVGFFCLFLRILHKFIMYSYCIQKGSWRLGDASSCIVLSNRQFACQLHYLISSMFTVAGFKEHSLIIPLLCKFNAHELLSP